MKDLVDKRSTSVLAIIVTYNGQQWIERCFGSLTHSTIPLDIVVVDNGSKDGTPSIIKAKFPNVTVIEAGKNLGFGKANNIGLKKCIDENYQYAFLLNQDAWVEPNTIELLIEVQSLNLKYGILCPLQLNPQGSKIDGQFFRYSISENNGFIFKLLSESNQATIYDLEFANAACWLIRSSVIQAIGGFDPIFPHYGEDEDYVRRLKAKGYRVGLYPIARVFHDREVRPKVFSWNREINKSFVIMIQQLKSTQDNNFIWYQIVFKNIYRNIVKILFFRGKSHLLCNIIANMKVLTKFKMMRNHLEKEGICETLYLNQLPD